MSECVRVCVQTGTEKRNKKVLEEEDADGDSVAQFVEYRLEIQRPEVRTPSGAQAIAIFLNLQTGTC